MTGNPDSRSVPLLKPKSASPGEGFLPTPSEASVHLAEDADPRLERAVLALAEDLARRHPGAPRLTLTRDPGENAFISLGIDQSIGGAEAHSMEVGERRVTLLGASSHGLRHALAALARILRANPCALPRMRLEDAPDLEERGFMLDVSRTKVPSTSAILKLVDRLAELRFNRLQLYVEHTFAFPGHEKVWADASPLTPKDLAKIDAHCRERFITLVPNLNGFGHFERWLKHEPYRHLAECPEGFWHDLARAHRPPGTLKPDQASLDFMAGLYDAYLPHFTAGEFNVGGDEPWELGMGASRELCERNGKQTVYLQHLDGLSRLCSGRGKRMQFWADILLEHPERAGEAPTEAVPVIWGYDAGHPFETQCATLRALGRRYLVAPGAGTWNSFSSRWENARKNIREAVDAARAHGAAGLLMTAWGDNGNHWAWPVMYPAITLAARLAWNASDSEDRESVLRSVDAAWFDGDGVSAELLLRYLETDAKLSKSVRNKSPLWELLFNPPQLRAEALESITESELRSVREHLLALGRDLRAAPPGAEPEFAAELRSGITLSLLAAARGLAEMTGERDPLLKASGFVMDEYRSAWLLRARKGGLDESAEHLRRAFRELSAR